MTGIPQRPIAAIDIGSNSVHLTLARMRDGRIDTFLRLKDPARLAAHLGPRKALSTDSVDRAIATLSRFRDLADVHGAEVRATATAAVRAASNRDEFIARAAVEAGVTVELISGHTEASLTYLGVRHGLPRLDGQSILAVDVGGGSTDLALGVGDRPELTASVAVGSLTLATRFLRDPVTKARVRQARRAVEAHLAEPTRVLAAAGFEHALATSGSIQRLARLIYPEARSLHGTLFTEADLRAATRMLALARTGAERRRLPGMDPERADSLLGGALVFEGLGRALGVKTWTISVTALRTGLILDTWRRRPTAD